MKVLLINPATKVPTHSKIPPLGIAYIAAVIEKANVNVEILDANLFGLNDEEVKKAILKSGADIVGVTATTTLINQALKTLKIAKTVLPNCITIMGGVHPTIFHSEILSKEGTVDIIVRGEGEETIFELIKTLRKKGNLKKIRGISYKKNGKVNTNPQRPLIKNLDSIPFPARDLLPNPKKYKSGMLKREPFTTIITTRGCPAQCIFCNKCIFGSLFRARSPENIIDEIELLVNGGIKEIHFLDDTFTLNRKHAEKICDMIIKRKIDITWTLPSGIRVGTVTKKLLQKMKNSGCYMTCVCVESGDERILNNIKKGITIEQVKKTFKMLKTVGIETTALFMLGNPGENEETMKKSIELAKELDPDYANFTIVTPLPGTPLWDLIKKEGKFLFDDWEFYGQYTGKAIFEIGEVKKELVEEMYKEAYRQFYNRPKYIFKQLKKLTSLSRIKSNLDSLFFVLKNVWRVM